MMVEQTPRISIIIATWNAATTLERCLMSITSQTYTSWELLIRDGGSTDTTRSIIEKHQTAVVWWKSAPDNGIYDAWNQAIAHATGDYVCFLGADDILADSDALHFMSQAICSRQPDIVSAKGLLISDQGYPVAEIGQEWNFRALRRRVRICHPGAWFRRELFATYGDFDVHYRIGADYEWLLRLPQATSAQFVDRIVVKMGDRGVSRTQVWRRLREHREARARSPRVGPVLAYIYWLDKLWRWPIAKLLGLQH